MRRKLATYKAPKYTAKDSAGYFADDAAYLEHIFKTRFPSGQTCPECGEAYTPST